MENALLMCALTFLGSNMLYISIFFVIALNFFFPASVVIVFYFGMYGPLLGALASFFILVLSSLIPFVLINTFSLNPLQEITNNSVYKLTKGARVYPIRTSFVIRATTIPYTAQNFASSMLLRSLPKYLAVNSLSLCPWIIVFGFFAQSLKEFRLGLLVLSLLLFISILCLSRKIENKWIKR